jgi:hypothetical protein
MRRYYFHIRRGRVTVIDQNGIDFADWVQAAQEAARRALEIEARDSLLDVFSRKGMILVDDEFRTILEVPFGGTA